MFLERRGKFKAPSVGFFECKQFLKFSKICGLDYFLVDWQLFTDALNYLPRLEGTSCKLSRETLLFAKHFRLFIFNAFKEEINLWEVRCTIVTQALNFKGIFCFFLFIAVAGYWLKFVTSLFNRFAIVRAWRKYECLFSPRLVTSLRRIELGKHFSHLSGFQ